MSNPNELLDMMAAAIQRIEVNGQRLEANVQQIDANVQRIERKID
jgi:hypothetical protein